MKQQVRIVKPAAEIVPGILQKHISLDGTIQQRPLLYFG